MRDCFSAGATSSCFLPFSELLPVDVGAGLLRVAGAVGWGPGAAGDGEAWAVLFCIWYSKSSTSPV